jgi:hypothetical protein
MAKRPCFIKEGSGCCTNMVINEAKMKNFISVCGALSRNPTNLHLVNLLSIRLALKIVVEYCIY